MRQHGKLQKDMDGTYLYFLEIWLASRQVVNIPESVIKIHLCRWGRIFYRPLLELGDVPSVGNDDVEESQGLNTLNAFTNCYSIFDLRDPSLREYGI